MPQQIVSHVNIYIQVTVTQTEQVGYTDINIDIDMIQTQINIDVCTNNEKGHEFEKEEEGVYGKVQREKSEEEMMELQKK